MFRFARRLAMLYFVVSLAFVGAVVVGLNAAWQAAEDIDLACADVFEERKTEQVGYHWDWLPPAWVCDYSDGTERPLPFGQR